jgi:hypothetical protein
MKSKGMPSSASSQQQIREQNRRVHLDPADGLQCDFSGEIGRSTDIEREGSRRLRYSLM